MEVEVEVPQEKIPVNYYKPINNQLNNLLSSNLPGECISKKLYFNSESWFNLLNFDIQNLLFQFTNDYLEQFNSSLEDDNDVEIDDEGKKKEKKELKSPYELFKFKWIELGWSYIHLLGILDGSMRFDWSTSLMRAFLEHIKKDEKPLYQFGSLFALYTLYFTQAATLEKNHIAVDCDTLDYILTIPTALSSFLLPPLDTPTQPIASASQTLNINSCTSDLDEIIYSLLAREAFFLIPTQSYLFPSLPSVTIKDRNELNLKETAKLVLGTEEEIYNLAKGDVESLNGIKSLLGFNEDGVSMGGLVGGGGEENDYTSIEKEWKDDSGWKGNLKEMQERYLKEKRKGFPLPSTSSTATSSTTGSSRKKQKTSITKSTLKSITLSQAQNLTLAALKDAASATSTAAGEEQEQGRGGIIPSLSVLDSNLDSNELELSNLVGKNNKRVEEEEEEDEKGLEVYERLLREFQKDVMEDKNSNSNSNNIVVD